MKGSLSYLCNKSKLKFEIKFNYSVRPGLSVTILRVNTVYQYMYANKELITSVPKLTNFFSDITFP